MKVSRIIFYALLKPAGKLQLVELEDGSLCITHDEKPLMERCWPQSELSQAVDEFNEFKRRLTPAN